MNRMLAIDPGTTHSAIVEMEDTTVTHKEKMLNADVLGYILGYRMRTGGPVVIERIASYGKPVGQEVFDTCVWIGQFVGASGAGSHLIFRKDVKMMLCGTSFKVTDGAIRQRLIDIYSDGQGKKVAIGLKKSPGPLYGFSADCWQALALAVTFGVQKFDWKLTK